MAISAALVKELRERTGLGMMDCKKALVDAEGSGQAKARTPATHLYRCRNFS